MSTDANRNATPEELAALTALSTAAMLAGMLGRRSFSVVAPDEPRAVACERLAIDALAGLRGTFHVRREGLTVTISMP